MALSLHDTLSGKKVPFAPADPGRPRIYVCGPTVYDYAHVGHARCYVVYDVLVRHLRASGLDVRYCRNVTDVDDKILKRAKENGETPTTLSERFLREFHADMTSLGNLSPDLEPKVTEHIPHIVRFIDDLVKKGAAYAAGDGGRDVYYSVPSFAEYGKLSHRPPDSLVEGASGRISDDEAKSKRHPADFALWKSADRGEWGWESPWGWGRPGWHIECSAMALEHLGETIDLHGGGLDLVFPHHENEIAQSEGRNGKPLARHWMHNGFVEVDKTKMGKSLGNFFTVRQILEHHGYEPEALRWAVLTVHYRSPLNFDWTLDDAGKVTGFPLFGESEKKVEYLYTTIERLRGIDPARIVPAVAVDGGATPPAVPPAIAGFRQAVAGALDDDLNMPVALAETGEMLKAVNEVVDHTRRKKNNIVSRATIDAAELALTALRTELGLGGGDPTAFLRRIRDRRSKARGITDADVEARIAGRKAAREEKDFARADALRAELTAMGVELMDAPSGETTWRIP